MKPIKWKKYIALDMISDRLVLVGLGLDFIGLITLTPWIFIIGCILMLFGYYWSYSHE